MKRMCLCYRCFRVVAAQQLIDHFASDRSHMEEQRDSIAPPPWPSIRGAAAASSMTLYDYIHITHATAAAVDAVANDVAAIAAVMTDDVGDSVHGDVLDLTQMMNWVKAIDYNSSAAAID